MPTNSPILRRERVLVYLGCLVFCLAFWAGAWFLVQWWL